MPTVTFVAPDGSQHVVRAAPGRSLMQLALDHGVPGILGDCGGACSCATCHGWVDVAWLPALPSIGESEASMLEAVAERQPGSRLCCQIRLTDALDGLTVHLPAEQG